MCAAAIFSDEDAYNINYDRPGIVVIFNNKYFRNNGIIKYKLTRKGSDKDVSRIYNIFCGLNFAVETHLDQDETPLRKLILEYSERDYSADSCFICFIMSHGINGQIKSSDNEDININEFVDPFKKNKTLQDKPKLFFIQACRGKKFMSINCGSKAITLDTDFVEEEKEEDEETEQEELEVESDSYVQNQSLVARIPIEADFLLCNSTVEGYYSWRKPSSGSFYIQTLCDVITRHLGKNIFELLTYVNNQVAQTEQMMPTFDSRLRKALYLTKYIQN